MEYQPLAVQRQAYPTQNKEQNVESRYWRQFRNPVFIKEYAPITCVHFSPSRPHRYAVTAATRVQIYTPRNQKVTKTISRFKDVARSGNIREDGKLLVAGDDKGLIQVFDINSRAILRTLDAHKQPVYVTKFSHLSPTHILSCSDDTTVKLWDVPSESAITTFTDHLDYVRSGQISKSNLNHIITGSYDGTVRLFDSRSGSCEMVMGGESTDSTPVEQVLLFDAGTVAVSAAGPILRVWDLVAGGRCLRAFSNHQKTITSLTFGSGGKRLLTGSLDHMVKVYDVETYRVMHTMRYPSPILCLAISPDETHIVAGMSDGTLSIRHRQLKSSETLDAEHFSKESLRSGMFETFLGAAGQPIGAGHIRDKTKAPPVGDADEFKVENKRKKKLKDYDKLLKGFKHSAALDSVLRKNIPPSIAFAMVQELIYRDALRAALAGRDDVLLEPVLQLLLKHSTDPRFSALACHVASIVIELYGPVLGQSPLIDNLFLKLKKNLDAELKLLEEMTQVKGALDMIFALSALSA